MLIEQPPHLMRALYPGALFRLTPGDSRRVALTFDDGPIPEATPMVLDILDTYGIKATFFMVGDNVRKYPHLLEEVKRCGHRVGNHTMHHLQGLRCNADAYLADVEEADALIGSRLFRPPHGLLRRSQVKRLEQKGYRMVMYDVVTRDYSTRTDARQVVDIVKRYTRDGSIIVFHDSLRSLPKLEEALRLSIEWLIGNGFDCTLI